jgi:hypothetical protein
MTEIEKAYVAGFVDGEGCISVCESGQNPLKSWNKTITITNTNRAILVRIRKQLKEEEPEVNGQLRIHYKGDAAYKRSYRLLYQGKKSVKIISLILPYLQVKKKVAQAVIDMPYRRPSWRGQNPDWKTYNKQLRFLKKIRKLNKRGGIK